MNKPALDLRRLWRDTRVAPESDARGYMGIFTERDDFDSLARFGFYPIKSLAPQECLFLLGRPGAGKSAEIERIDRGEIAAFRDEWIVLIRCKEAGLDLHPEIIRDPKWIAGLRQPKPVRLVLDGLDEGFLREPAYFSRLKRTLEVIRSEHLALRLTLTCRPAEWDAEFGESIHALWRAIGKPAVFALEPLSAKNRHTLVEHWKVEDTNEFFRWMHRNRFDEFAAWPRSLKWLVEQFQFGRGENITYTQLCQLRVARSFGEDKRLSEARLAARAEAWSHAIMLIAAMLVFCGRKGIALDRPEPDCLTLDDLFQAADRLEIPGRPALTREDLREAVRTSPLIEARDGFHRFENQSDLEFLAGAMLASLDVKQLREVLGSPDDEGNWRVFPQLATTAANLAAQSPHFFDYLLAHDPRVLMRVDFASKSSDARRAAVDAMLNATAKMGATGEHDQHPHFFTLRHPEITAQLRPWIFDEKKSPIVRELAFDIARECCGGEFCLECERAAAAGDEFTESKLPLLIRLFGKTWSEKKLRAWARHENDRMAGAALMALREQGRGLKDLAGLLREPRGDGFSLYQSFLSSLSRECTADDVPAALAVIGSWRSVGASHGPVRDLIFALVSRGVVALHRRDVRKALTKFLITRFEDDDWLLGDCGSQCGLDVAPDRRALLLALAEDWPAKSRAAIMPFKHRLLREDYPWLLDALVSAKGTAALVLGKFAACLAWQFDETLRDPLERAYAVSPAFRSHLPAADDAGIFATLQRLRAESEATHQARLEERRAKRNRTNFSHAEFLADALARCRVGQFNAWTDVCFGLSQPKSEQDGSEFFRNTDPRQLAGWIAASDELQAEMTEFARQFLLHGETPMPETNSISVEFGLTYALSLHASRLGEDAELRAAIRPVWALALLNHCGSEDGPLAVPLAALTATAPAVVADACRHTFRERWERNEPLFGQLLPAAWCAETESALAEVLASAPLQPETYMSGLDMLAGHNVGLAKQLAAQRLAGHVAQPDDSAARRAAIAACLFVLHDLWEKAWPHLLSDRGAARQLLLEYNSWLDYHNREQRIVKMPDELIAALYGLLIEAFPLEESPRHEGPHRVGPLDAADRLRGHLQRVLEARGAHGKLSAIYQRCDETREAWWPRSSIARAQNIAHVSRREPPSAAQFVRFLATEGGTFVSDNDSLQRAVLASLGRFEQSLKPDGLLSIWENGEPRSEEVLQVEIARHLRREFEERRIVVNMETKVLRERSDIRVEAGPHVVTLEIKLGHSKDRERPLRTAMRSQLRAYLENQNETHGIYVVGWFFSPTFRPNALRDLKTLPSARRFFDMQARKLSTAGFALTASVLDCRWPESPAIRAHMETRGAAARRRTNSRGRARSSACLPHMD